MAVQGETREKTRNRIREPRRYHVIMHNDDYTPMDFVVDLLTGIFHKNEAEAHSLMLKVHHEGQAVVGMYTYDIAITKVGTATAKAKQAGYPFRMTVKEV